MLDDRSPFARHRDLALGYWRQLLQQIDPVEREHHARRPGRARHVDRADAGMRHRAAHQDAVQHTRQYEISDELSLARQQPAVFAPQQRTPDVRVSCVVHWSTPRCRCASLRELPGEVQLCAAGLSIPHRNGARDGCQDRSILPLSLRHGSMMIPAARRDAAVREHIDNFRMPRSSPSSATATIACPTTRNSRRARSALVITPVKSPAMSRSCGPPGGWTEPDTRTTVQWPPAAIARFLTLPNRAR